MEFPSISGPTPLFSALKVPSEALLLRLQLPLDLRDFDLLLHPPEALTQPTGAHPRSFHRVHMAPRSTDPYHLKLDSSRLHSNRFESAPELTSPACPPNPSLRSAPQRLGSASQDSTPQHVTSMFISFPFIAIAVIAVILYSFLVAN